MHEARHGGSRWGSRAVAAAQAVAIVCPTTEADLGDGVFDYPTFTAAGGSIAIGSDSQVSRDWLSELRMHTQSSRPPFKQRGQYLTLGLLFRGC